MDVDEEWAQQIRMRKFEIYNEEWMQAIEEDAQLEAYYDGGGDEADLEARIGALVSPLSLVGLPLYRPAVAKLFAVGVCRHATA